MWGSYNFGVEIELIAAPRQTRHPLRRAVYYETLASTLRSKGCKAAADRLDGKYAKHPEHYDKWWITKDGSLGNPEHPLIPLEAVSPTLNTTHHWEREISTFWASFNLVFQPPLSSRHCGSHVHVSPSPSRHFTIPQLQNLAFGIIIYEDLIMRLLPNCRRNSDYCKPNTEHSLALKGVRNGSWVEVWERVKRRGSKRGIRDFMQLSGSVSGSVGERRDRYVLWNFDNVLEGRSGSVEFRGGRGLRGPERTKRWVAFVVAFVHFCVGVDFHSWPRHKFKAPNMQQFWAGLISAAREVSVKDSLPSDWRAMAETTSDGLLEGLCDFDDEDSDSESDSMKSKSDSKFTEPDILDGDLEVAFQGLRLVQMVMQVSLVPALPKYLRQ